MLCCYANLVSIPYFDLNVEYVFLDLAKSFDEVDHSLRVNKLIYSSLHLQAFRVSKEFKVNGIH